MSHTMNDYQNQARETAIYPAGTGLTYTTLGLASEAGEVAGKLKKIIRDGDGIISDQQRLDLADEAGDCLWYVAMLAHELGMSLETLATRNLDKLASRKERGALQGSGDDR